MAGRGLKRAAVVLGATAAALLAWVVSGPLAGAEMDVRFGDTGAADHVNARAVIVTALALGLLGWGLLELLERRGAARAWRPIAIAALALTLLGPLLAGLTTGTTIGLLAVHLAAGLPLIALLPSPR